MFSFFKAHNSLALDYFSRFSEYLKNISNEQFSNSFPTTLCNTFNQIYLCDIVRIYRINKKYTEFKLVGKYPIYYSSPQNIELDSRNIADGLIGKAFNTSKIQFYDSSKRNDQRDFISIDDKIKFEIIIPILYKSNVIELVILDFFEKVPKHPQESIYLIANQLNNFYSQKIESLNLDKRLSFINKLPFFLTKGMDFVLQNFFDLLSDLYEIKFLNFWTKINNSNDEYLILRYFYPFEVEGKKVTISDYDRTIIKASESLSNNTLVERKPKLYQDLNSIDQFSNKTILKNLNLKTCISIPIEFKNEFFGIINFFLYKKELSENELLVHDNEIINQLFGSIISLVNYHNNELLTESYDKIFNNLFWFEDEQIHWNNIAHLITELLNCEACSIFEKENDEIVLVGTTGIIGDPNYSEVRYKKGEGLTGNVFEGNRPLIYYSDIKAVSNSNHISKYREKNISGKSSNSIIFSPLNNSENEIIGVIRCNNKSRSQDIYHDRFTNEDLSKLLNIGKIISNIYLKIKSIKKFNSERERNIYSLHHELIAPVLSINTHAEWFIHHIEKNRNPNDWNVERIKVKFNDIRNNSFLLNVLVKSMENLDNIVLNFDEINLYSLIKDCKHYMYEEERMSDIMIEWSYLDLPQTIHADKTHLTRVFYNLFRNSFKYYDKNEKKSYIKINADNLKDRVIIYIEDNGIGIPEDEIDSIFRKFRRGVNAIRCFPQGTGLGLTYCKNIIEKHYGEIIVKNNFKPTIIQFSIAKNLNLRK